MRNAVGKQHGVVFVLRPADQVVRGVQPVNLPLRGGLDGPEQHLISRSDRHNAAGQEQAAEIFQRAMAAFMTLVPMALFFCFQKMMIGGVKMGALKG